ncbi:MAG: zinc dependent phospholipase C family protein [Saprospiraceae bacterium]
MLFSLKVVAVSFIMMFSMVKSPVGPAKVNSWGFYGHRLINQMAVYTLPNEMFGFFKKNILYITEHSIDPDKRRYATRHEGVRHYIDIDHWDKIPFPNVPRDFEEAIIKYCEIYHIVDKDTIAVSKTIERDSIFLHFNTEDLDPVVLDYPTFLKYWKRVIKPMYYEDVWSISKYDLNELFSTTQFLKKNYTLLIKDKFSEYGIVPYHLENMLVRMTNAFKSNDQNLLLRMVSEYGHYVSDAHVPLHTTKNYNGQMTNQVGIHAFWESRIPELFAENEYDFFVGQAQYIENPRDFIWDIVIQAHSHLDSLLSIELRLSKNYPLDNQYCYDERLSQTVRIQCKEYAKAYSKAMGTMVEDQMRASIHAVGSFWYTAWVNAGQPKLDGFNQIEYVPDVIVPDKKINTRQHDNE